MLTRILLPLDPSRHALAAFNYAAGLAKMNNAEITGFMVLDTPEIEKTARTVTPGAIEYARKAEQRREAQAHEHIQELLARFSSRCTEQGIRHKTVEVQGAPADMIIGESVFYDLVVMGIETHYNFETSDQPSGTLEGIAGRMMAPVIAVPLKPYDPGLAQRVTVAFGGSRSAARSIRQFVNLGLFKDAEITILCSNPEIEIANRLMAAVARYLDAHGFERVVQEWTPEPVQDALRDEFLGPSDLVVLGAHAKHGILSFLYGKVTKYVLSDSSTPVFIAS
jgi:nucleotide-binding universal stress UspA family protein